MPAQLSESPLALVHGSLRVFANADQGLVISPPASSHDQAGPKSAVRLRWGTEVPQAIEWEATAGQDGLEVHCLGGILVGFERQSPLASSSYERFAG